MKSSKIKSLNNNVKANDSILVKVKSHNEIIEDLEFLYPKVNQRFEGSIYLGRMLTHYETFTVDSALEVKLDPEVTIGGSAEIRFIGDNATTPTFNSAFTVSAGSSAYDPTLNAKNKVIFYYDGTSAFYSITVL